MAASVGCYVVVRLAIEVFLLRGDVLFMAPYLPIFIMLVIGVLFAAGSFVGSGLLAPKKRTEAKYAPYECGIVPRRDPASRFPVRFYLIAMIFIIFDIEIIFLYPFAVVFGQLGAFGLSEMVVFAIVVFVSFVYLISNGALDWGPAKSFGLQETYPERTSSSTVKRISGNDEAA